MINPDPAWSPAPPPRPAQHTPPKKRRKWPWVLGALLLLLVIVGLSSGGSKSSPQAPSSTTAAQPAPATVPAPAPAPQTQAPAPQVSGPLTSFGNGTYAIGTDIAPGKYRSPAPQSSISPLCYWDMTDDNGAIKGQGVANEGPTITAVLKKGLTFKSSGCENWSKVG